MQRFHLGRAAAARTDRDWVRALAHCGVLRVAFDDDTLIAGIEAGFVSATPVEGNDDALDCRLTDAGRALLPKIGIAA